ncbi:SixA phosphatase family protein [Nocardioides sp. GXZ039]|uniref:SixA phosphatase family protein n=1 Tax=Nocardioides sp. GXZ039 TaxID=3136018 RepID=UPI0030F44092
MRERTSRTLVVMRHAKAEAHGPTDALRELSERGRDDAAEAGRWLAHEGFVPQQALVSSATRTAQTWESLAGAAGWTVAPALDRGLYAADVDSALETVRAADDAHTSLIVVGHNPTMADLALLLDDGRGERAAGDALAAHGFPTSALAVFEVTGPWEDLGPGTARLAGHHVGRA